MRPDERVALRERFGCRCGHRGISEVDVGAELTVPGPHPALKPLRSDPDACSRSSPTERHHRNRQVASQRYPRPVGISKG
jgi:hypothetical protein